MSYVICTVDSETGEPQDVATGCLTAPAFTALPDPNGWSQVGEIPGVLLFHNKASAEWFTREHCGNWHEWTRIYKVSAIYPPTVGGIIADTPEPA